MARHRMCSKLFMSCVFMLLSLSILMSCVFMLLSLFILAMWSPAGKGLTSLLLFVMFNCVFVFFPCGILHQVWYLIVLIPDLCSHSYFVIEPVHEISNNLVCATSKAASDQLAHMRSLIRAFARRLSNL